MSGGETRSVSRSSDFRFRLLPERRAAQRLAARRARPAMDSNASRTASARSSSNVAGHHGCRVACASRPASNAAPKRRRPGRPLRLFGFSAEARLKLAFSSKDAPARSRPACVPAPTNRATSTAETRRDAGSSDASTSSRSAAHRRYTLRASSRCASRDWGCGRGASWSRRSTRETASRGSVRAFAVDSFAVSRDVSPSREPSPPFSAAFASPSSRTRASRMTATSRRSRARACGTRAGTGGHLRRAPSPRLPSSRPHVEPRARRRSARCASTSARARARGALPRTEPPATATRSAVRARRGGARGASPSSRAARATALDVGEPRHAASSFQVASSEARKTGGATKRGTDGVTSSSARRAFRLERVFARLRSSSQRRAVVWPTRGAHHLLQAPKRARLGRLRRGVLLEVPFLPRLSSPAEPPLLVSSHDDAGRGRERRARADGGTRRAFPADGRLRRFFQARRYTCGLSRRHHRAHETRALTSRRPRFSAAAAQVLDALRVGEMLGG